MDKLDLNYFNPILNFNHVELFNVDLFLDWNNKKKTFLIHLIHLGIPIEISVITINWMKWTQKLIKLSSINDLFCYVF